MIDSMVTWVQTIWDYNYWAQGKLKTALASISEANFKAPISYSVGSLHEQVVHTMWAEALWLTRVKGEARVTFSTEEYPTLEAVYTKWDAIKADWLAYVAQLTPAELTRSLTVSPSRGNQYQHTVGQIALHVVNHSTDHRSQMLRILYDFGGSTFEQDMIFYFREQEAGL